MKKQFLITLIILALILAGCSNGASTSARWNPVQASDKVVPYAERAIELIDLYLDFDISAKELKSEMSSLYDRMHGSTIQTGDDYNKADKEIARYIFDMKSYTKSDDTCKQYREKISFLIGIVPNGIVTPAKREISNEEDSISARGNLKNFVDVDSVPFSRGYADKDIGFWSVRLTFDMENGVKVSDLEKYINQVLQNFKDFDLDSASVSCYYDCFGESVFDIHIHVYEDKVYGSVGRMDDEYWDAYWKCDEKYTREEISEFDINGYPEEFSILNDLYQFDSLKKLPTALKIASDFLGME